MDAKIAEVLQASKDALAGAVATRDAVALIGPEIDKIEAAITDLKSKTNLSAEDSAALDEVIGNARAVVSAAADTTTAAGAAASDAADGIDEAVNTGGGTPTP